MYFYYLKRPPEDGLQYFKGDKQSIRMNRNSNPIILELIYTAVGFIDVSRKVLKRKKQLGLLSLVSNPGGGNRSYAISIETVSSCGFKVGAECCYLFGALGHWSLKCESVKIDLKEPKNQWCIWCSVALPTECNASTNVRNSTAHRHSIWRSACFHMLPASIRRM